MKLEWQGRVYRSGSLSPSKAGGRRYAPPGQLLGAPDEYSIDAAYEACSSSQLQDSPSIKRSVLPPEGSGSDSDLEIDRSSPSPAFPAVNNAVPRSYISQAAHDSDIDPLAVVLPPHYATFVNMHAALERALMMHLSTEGKGGRIASAVAQAFRTGSYEDTPLVNLPNLITYHQLRPMIEGAGGHQFSETQFARLVWLWSESADAAPEDLSGLGFLVNKTVGRKRSSEQKVISWGIGIQLRIRRTEEPSLALVGLSAAPPSPKRARTAAENARDGMSVVALWSLGAEARKEAVKRKLGLLVIAHYQVRLRFNVTSL